jgi:hypothetical protein
MTLEKVERLDGTFYYFINYDEQQFVVESEKRLSTDDLKQKLDEGDYEL